MNSRKILLSISALVLVIGFCMVGSMLVGFLMGDNPADLQGFTWSIGICLALGIAGLVAFWRKRPRQKASTGQSALRDGFLIILLSWVVAMLLGALPFIIGAGMRVSDALFETASGLSTTGASVIENNIPLLGGETLAGGLEALPKALLFWRQMLHWLGGIGFVMFVLLLLPKLGGGKQLYNAEVTGMKSSFDQTTPRIASTARMMLGFYILLTAAVTLAYRFGGMDSLYDAVCHAFATVATGGFSTHAANFGYYSTKPALQWIATAGMFLSATNFMLLMKLLFHGRFEFHHDEEFKTYFAIVLACTMICTVQLLLSGQNTLLFSNGRLSALDLESAIRVSAFHVVSVFTSTGFVTSDYTSWNLPGLPMMVLMLICIGGCGGSTCGGMKISRSIVTFKHCINEVRRKFFPHLMQNVFLNNVRIDPPVVQQTIAFMTLYVGTLCATTLLLPYLSNMDLETSLSAAVTTLGNAGPGLGALGPANTFAAVSTPAKLLLTFNMIAGRLELFTAFVILLPSFWKTRNVL